MVERNQFYEEAVDQVLSCQTGNLSASEAARRVALMYDINILECDKAKIKVTIYSRIRAAKSMDDVVVVVPSEPVDVGAATTNIGHEARGAKRRRAGADGGKTRCQARADAGDMLPSSKLHRQFKGTSSHLDYQ